MEYVSIRPPTPAAGDGGNMAGAVIHYVDSINPLADFTHENQFELSESSGWPGYQEFCATVARDRRPDIIHVHNEANLIPLLRAAAPLAKFVLHVNDEVVTRMNPRELSALAGTCDLILSCSDYIRRTMQAAFDAAEVKPPPMELFYNFVDLKEYDPAIVPVSRVDDLRARYQLGNGPVVLFVGRMIEQKGPHLALRAFQRVVAARPDAMLLFVGAPWYSRENESPFVDYVRSEGAALSDRIRFTGYVDQASMPHHYALADVVCAPSIWDDPSPFVTYEAQAMAKPIIGSTRGGIPEIIHDHVTGRCIDVFNTPLFARILSEWLDAPAEACSIGQRGRARMIDQFGLGDAENLLEQVYDGLLSGTGVSAAGNGSLSTTQQREG